MLNILSNEQDNPIDSNYTTRKSVFKLERSGFGDLSKSSNLSGSGSTGTTPAAMSPPKAFRSSTGME